MLPPEIRVDTSRRSSHGIRISLSAPAVSAGVSPAQRAALAHAGRMPMRIRDRPHTRYGAGWAGPSELALPGTDRIRSLEYVVVDVETTGGACDSGHRITEVCAVRVSGDGAITGEFTTLVNPDRYIPPAITQLTRITHDMVSFAPRFDEVAPELRDFLEGAVFVAHNAAFDWRFVAYELVRACLEPLYARVLCTVRLARKIVPEVSSRSLDALSWYFGVENEARHRAFGDARATALIFQRLLDRMDEREIERWEQLETLMRKRGPRRKRRASPQPVWDA